MLGPQTQLQLRPAAQSPIKLTGAAVEEAAKTNIFRSDWCQPWGGRRGSERNGRRRLTSPGGVRRSFEAMGIGGLDQEFSDIFRRAFASRIFPVSVMKKLGISHVKGTALHGPPGTGTAPSPHSRGCGQA